MIDFQSLSNRLQRHSINIIQDYDLIMFFVYKVRFTFSNNLLSWYLTPITLLYYALYDFARVFIFIIDI